MKTTIEIPDTVFREAKATAAKQGRPLKDFVAEALTEKLGDTRKDVAPAWHRALGALRHLKTENRRVGAWIADEFERVGPEETS